MARRPRGTAPSKRRHRRAGGQDRRDASTGERLASPGRRANRKSHRARRSSRTHRRTCAPHARRRRRFQRPRNPARGIYHRRGPGVGGRRGGAAPGFDRSRQHPRTEGDRGRIVDRLEGRRVRVRRGDGERPGPGASPRPGRSRCRRRPPQGVRDRVAGRRRRVSRLDRAQEWAARCGNGGRS